MSKEESKPESFSRDDVKAMMEIARKQGIRTRDIEADKAFTDLYKRMTDAETELSELRKENEELTLQIQVANTGNQILESQIAKAKEYIEGALPFIKGMNQQYKDEIESFLKS